jgi:predicted nucleotidyltransferase
MVSKENVLLETFFNSQKHWHFEELRKFIKIGKPQLARWLKVFQKQGIIKRIKPQSKMPYYVANFSHPHYINRKNLFAMQKMTESGLFDHLLSLQKTKVVIVFGSFSRADWHQDSDIDIFFYGNDTDFEQGKYELKLKRNIQLHTAKNTKDLQKIDKLLPYIIAGDFIKGSIEDLGVDIHAKA